MLMKMKRRISKEVRRRLLERRTRIFTKWLKINFEKQKFQKFIFYLLFCFVNTDFYNF